MSRYLCDMMAPVTQTSQKCLSSNSCESSSSLNQRPYDLAARFLPWAWKLNWRRSWVQFPVRPLFLPCFVISLRYSNSWTSNVELWMVWGQYFGFPGPLLPCISSNSFYPFGLYSHLITSQYFCYRPVTKPTVLARSPNTANFDFLQ